MKNSIVISLILLFFSTSLQAVESQGLYRAEVEVPDQGAEARGAGMQQAMGEVLLKVSGTGQVLLDEALVEATASAARYAQQYRYRSEAIPEEERKPDEEGRVAEERLLLAVRFDRQSVDELLRSHGYTVWGAARPSTLIWLGVEQGNSRVLVGANDSGLVRALVDQEAKRRALPVKLPLLDLTDQSQVRPVDIWGDFLDTIEQASVRYSPQAILVGRLYPAGSQQWEVRWTLIHQGEVSRWRQQSEDIAMLIAGGIGQTSEQLVQSFTRSFVAGSGNMMLEVVGVESLRHYRRVKDYLSGVHGVNSVIADTVNPHQVRFNLQTEGGREAVLQTIALGDVLERLPNPEPVEVVVPQPPLPQQPPQAEPSAEGMGEQGDETLPVMTAEPQPEVIVPRYRLIP